VSSRPSVDAEGGPVAKPAVAWKLGRPDRESDAPSPMLSSAPPPPPMRSIGAHAKLALMGGVAGVAALAGWLAFMGPEPAPGAGPASSAPAVLATGDSDQVPASAPAPVVVATPPRPTLSEEPVPLEDLPLAASPAATTNPRAGIRPKRSAKPKRFNPTDI
jgi:hypothetical protein